MGLKLQNRREILKFPFLFLGKELFYPVKSQNKVVMTNISYEQL